jgi:cytidine deaminase
MTKEEKERRALMRRIWNLNVTSEEGRYRLRSYGNPWLVENFYEPEVAHLGHELRINFDSRRTARQLPMWERVQRFRQSIPYLYREACAAREKAMSYHGFKVGSAALAFKNYQFHSDAWKVFAGMNTKHARNMRPTCSEPITINAAYAENYSLIIGIVVVGELREEDVGKLLTLHPCQDCRWFMYGHPLIDWHTLVLTAYPEPSHLGYYSARIEDWGWNKKMFEIRTVGQLLRMHRRVSGDDFE